MKLHYSQTDLFISIREFAFYYHMKLHYSQTCASVLNILDLFYYHMKLHYSQTNGCIIIIRIMVLLPYEITLLSNMIVVLQA